VTSELPTSRTVVALRRKGDERASTSRTLVALCRKGDKRASTSRTVVALRRGHLALLVGRLAELPPLSLPSSFWRASPRLM
jgi:hypothetical protein